MTLLRPGLGDISVPDCYRGHWTRHMPGCATQGTPWGCRRTRFRAGRPRQEPLRVLRPRGRCRRPRTRCPSRRRSMLHGTGVVFWSPPRHHRPPVNAVQREGGSPEPQPDVEDGPSPVVPPVSFFPSFSGPDTPPTPPMVQRTTRPLSRPAGRPKQPALTSRPAPPDAARAVDEATSADSSPGDIHGPTDLSGSRPATPRGQLQSRLSFVPPAASTPVTPTRRSNRHVNTNTNINNPRLSITRRRHIQRVWKEYLGT